MGFSLFRPLINFYAPQLQNIYFYIARYYIKNSMYAWGVREICKINEGGVTRKI